MVDKKLIERAREILRRGTGGKPPSEAFKKLAREFQGLANQELANSNFAEGWQLFNYASPRRRLWREKYAEDAAPRDWRGLRVALVTERGIGDELMFSRFVPQLRALGPEQIIYVRKDDSAVEVFRRSGLFDDVITPSGQPFPVHYTCLIDRLPLLVGMTHVSQIPAPIAIAPLPRKQHSVNTRLKAIGNGPFLGITWRAGHPRALYKEAPLDELARAVRSWPGEIVVLQRQPKPSELRALEDSLSRRVHDFSDTHNDIEESLAVVSLLDDYVAVSNTNVHLRASVGRTSRILVPYPYEYRCMASGSRSPWFPGCKLYRQLPSKAWSQAFVQLGDDLPVKMNVKSCAETAR